MKKKFKDLEAEYLKAKRLKDELEELKRILWKADTCVNMPIDIECGDYHYRFRDKEKEIVRDGLEKLMEYIVEELKEYD